MIIDSILITGMTAEEGAVGQQRRIIEASAVVERTLWYIELAASINKERQIICIRHLCKLFEDIYVDGMQISRCIYA